MHHEDKRHVFIFRSIDKNIVAELEHIYLYIYLMHYEDKRHVITFRSIDENIVAELENIYLFIHLMMEYHSLKNILSEGVNLAISYASEM